MLAFSPLVLLGLRCVVLAMRIPKTNKFPFPKLELHLHLDGAARFTTLLELSKQKGIPLGGATTEDELKKLLVSTEPASLQKVLTAFDTFDPLFVDDPSVMERIAYETAEDLAADGVVYFEARYSPQEKISSAESEITLQSVVEAVWRGLSRAEADFGIHGRQILCCIAGMPEWNWKILDLVKSCAHLGVVGIDVAGSSASADEKYEQSVIDVFREATRLGLHRTVHAGEAGGVADVVQALEAMSAERIGHGYRVLNDEEVYRENFVDSHRAHLEACPLSSYLTGAVKGEWKDHPIKRWAADAVDFSISRDDPTCFDNSYADELDLVHDDIGLSLHEIWTAQLNAARASFAPEPLKGRIIQQVLAAEPTKI